MGKLTKCRSCKGKVARSAPLCPHCGMKKPGGPKQIGCIPSLIAAFMVFWFVGYVINRSENPAPTPAPPQAPAETSTQPTTQPTTRPPAPPPRTSVCETVGRGTMDALASGLDIQGGGSILRAEAVKSGAHANGYFVAASMGGPGMDGAVGVWLTTGDLNNPAMILSVDALAKEFSVFPDASRTAAQATMSDPGAREARDCLR